VRSLLLVDFKAKLAKIDQPVLVVNGTLDARAISQEAGFVAAAPHATAYHFENTLHGVSMRRSAEFAALVNDFAARALAAPQPPKP
jgi:pimeloyl-ACP methyl ester carboxylesterase